MLNQVVRPFTAKWHRLSVEGAFNNSDVRQNFRAELASLQKDLRNYSRLLAEVAQVEDMTELSKE